MRTTGVPASPHSRTRTSIGTCASSGTSVPVVRVRLAATASPPPVPNSSSRVPSGCSSQDMFSITPTTCWRVCRATDPARSATSDAASCGVVTKISSEAGSSWATEIAMSPVPGGRSSSSTSRSPQKTSARNCCRARCSIGPRHTTGWPAGTNIPIEMTLMLWAMGGKIMSSTRVGVRVTPSIRGIEKP